MKKVAVLGTQGVPAGYGGFESLVENIIGWKSEEGVDYTVFCSSRDLPGGRDSYKGAELKYIPLHANGMQSIPYDIWSMCRCVGRKYDSVLVLGVSGCLFLPVFKWFYRGKVIVNIDGQEYRRMKWGAVARWVLRKSEAVAVRYADVVIADNKGIRDYVAQTYGKEPVMIAYGGDQVLRDIPEDVQTEILDGYSLKKGEYAVSVCRIEPENNCHIILEAFARTGAPLVYVGNWGHSDYSRMLKEKYSSFRNILLLNSVYNLDLLFTLRFNAGLYVHGHSAGGTNPSLVEAMFLSRPIAAFDVVYNRETTKGKASYFSDCDSLVKLIESRPDNGGAMLEIARSNYTWARIVREYESLY